MDVVNGQSISRRKSHDGDQLSGMPPDNGAIGDHPGSRTGHNLDETLPVVVDDRHGRDAVAQMGGPAGHGLLDDRGLGPVTTA